MLGASSCSIGQSIRLRSLRRYASASELRQALVISASIKAKAVSFWCVLLASSVIAESMNISAFFSMLIAATSKTNRPLAILAQETNQEPAVA